MGIRNRQQGTRLSFLFVAGAIVVALGILGFLTGGGESAAAAPTTEILTAPVDGAQPVPHAKGAGATSHADPFALILLEIGLIILAAALGRWAALKLDQPPVLGELILGVLMGNVFYQLDVPFFVVIMHLDSAQQIFHHIWTDGGTVAQAVAHTFGPAELAPGGVGEKMGHLLNGPDAANLVTMMFAMWMFSQLGVILLLFLVGLESTVREMVSVGPTALAVAVVGVVLPFGMGFAASSVLLPGDSVQAHLFVAAILCATSVGITARVFKDLNVMHLREAKIILGAAVIDDVLGLIILAVVAGIVQTGHVEPMAITKLSLLSIAFLGAMVLLGEKVLSGVLPRVQRVFPSNFKLLFPLGLAFMISYLANMIGLATIVGAFAAGLILNDTLFREEGPGTPTLHQVIAPLEAIFAPIFFVLMGLQVNLMAFTEPATLMLGGAFLIAAIIGKVATGLVVPANLDRLTIGFGMVPRGEVGLIFAATGKSLGVVTDSIFSAVVIMVIITTLLPPLALKWSLARFKHPPAPSPPTGPIPDAPAIASLEH